jgi:N-glycosidase YbiA
VSGFRVAGVCATFEVMAQDGDPPRPVIRFYSVNDDYGAFSNFARYSIRLKGKRWPTSEHYFQAQKFADAREQEEIRCASTPMLAAQWGRDRKRKLRRDWESAKLGVMREAVEAKFRQHADLRALLLATGDAKLVEHTENDAFWGDGGDGSGRNELGRILMSVRDRLRSEIAYR